MPRHKIGIRLESFNLPLRGALAEAQRLGVAGVQVDAVGDLGPNNLSDTGRREFLHLLRGHNLELTALGCPLRRGLGSTQDQQQRIDHVRKVMALSFDLGPRVTVIEAGAVPEKAEDRTVGPMREALLDLSRWGDRTGVILALETGLESGDVLAAYLKTFDTGSLRANLDPGNFLQQGFDPIAGARALAGLVAHSHATDARAGNVSRAAREVPLGHGDIDWLQYLAVLEEIEYRGWLTIEREGGEDRLADLTEGVAFLRRLVT